MAFIGTVLIFFPQLSREGTRMAPLLSSFATGSKLDILYLRSVILPRADRVERGSV